ncbi:MAG: hypothetical protein ACLT8B_09405, partial [Ruminococcus sp.]
YFQTFCLPFKSRFKLMTLLDIPFAEPQETGDPSRVNFRKFHKGGFWKNRPICGNVSGSFVLSAPKSCKGVSPNHAIR